MNNMQSAESKRIEYFDAMRIICMLGVIVIHVVGHHVDGKPVGAVWHTANLLEGFARFSVPVFMMITGALLLKTDSSLSLKTVYLKRMPRVLVPAFVWACIYAVLICTQKFSAPFDCEKLKNILSDIWATPVYEHLWYVYALVAFYILLPILRLLIKNCSMNFIGYCLLIWFAASCVLPTLSSINGIFKVTPDADLNVRSGYIGLFVLGYYLDNLKIKLKPGYLAAAFIAASLGTAVLSFYYLKARGDALRPFYEYFSPNVVVSSAAAFLLLKAVLSEKPAIKNNKHIIISLSNAVFGVYLCHEFFRTLLYELLRGLNPFAEMAVSFIVTVAVSFAFSLICSKIKYICYVFTGNKNPAALKLRER